MGLMLVGASVGAAVGLVVYGMPAPFGTGFLGALFGLGVGVIASEA